MRVLVFGASLADGLNVGGQEATTIVTRWGETTVGLLPTLKDALDKGPFDVVVLVAGTNDLANDASPHPAIDNLMRMHRQCKTSQVQLSIGVTLRHAAFNQHYQQRCRKVGVPVCEFLHENIDSTMSDEDGVHLSGDGKRAFTRAIQAIAFHHFASRFLTACADFHPSNAILVLDYADAPAT